MLLKDLAEKNNILEDIINKHENIVFVESDELTSSFFDSGKMSTIPYCYSSQNKNDNLSDFIENIKDNFGDETITYTAKHILLAKLNDAGLLSGIITEKINADYELFDEVTIYLNGKISDNSVRALDEKRNAENLTSALQILSNADLVIFSNMNMTSELGVLCMEAINQIPCAFINCTSIDKNLPSLFISHANENEIYQNINIMAIPSNKFYILEDAFYNICDKTDSIATTFRTYYYPTIEELKKFDVEHNLEKYLPFLLYYESDPFSSDDMFKTIINEYSYKESVAYIKKLLKNNLVII